jgi:hypothetical protein
MNDKRGEGWIERQRLKATERTYSRAKSTHMAVTARMNENQRVNGNFGGKAKVK